MREGARHARPWRAVAALFDAEPVLLVDDGEREPRELRRLPGTARACPPRSGHRRSQRRSSSSRRARAVDLAGQQGDRLLERREPAREILRVLLGEELGRRHDRDLPAAANRARGGQCGDHGLARTDIALDEPQHRPIAREVVIDLLDDSPLRSGQLERQIREQALLRRACYPREARRPPSPRRSRNWRRLR